MRALVAAAAVAAVVVPTAQSRSQSKPVVVIATKSYRLLAWGSGHKVCTQLATAGHSASSCGTVHALSFGQLPDGVGSRTFVGGVASTRGRTVDVAFANGATLHLKARHSRRYHRHVRFFAGREKSVSSVSSIIVKDAHGRTVQSVQVTPPGQPTPLPPPQPPKPCGCPPPPTLRACPAVVCPYAERAWTRNS
jgi:hypothetical protein